MYVLYNFLQAVMMYCLLSPCTSVLWRRRCTLYEPLESISKDVYTFSTPPVFPLSVGASGFVYFCDNSRDRWPVLLSSLGWRAVIFFSFFLSFLRSGAGLLCLAELFSSFCWLLNWPFLSPAFFCPCFVLLPLPRPLLCLMCMLFSSSAAFWHLLSAITWSGNWVTSSDPKFSLLSPSFTIFIHRSLLMQSSAFSLSFSILSLFLSLFILTSHLIRCFAPPYHCPSIIFFSLTSLCVTGIVVLHCCHVPLEGGAHVFVPVG